MHLFSRVTTRPQQGPGQLQTVDMQVSFRDKGYFTNCTLLGETKNIKQTIEPCGKECICKSNLYFFKCELNNFSLI